MLKNTVFVVLLIAALLLIFAVGDVHADEKATVATCVIDKNKRIFFCINPKKQEPCVKPEVKPEVKPKVSNPLLDLLNNKAKEY